MTDHQQTDKGTGLAVLLSLIAVGGALVTYSNPGNAAAGWGFAIAVAAAGLAVAAVHAYA